MAIKYKVSNNRNAISRMFLSFDEAKEYAMGGVKSNDFYTYFIIKLEDLLVVKSDKLLKPEVPVLGVDCNE